MPNHVYHSITASTEEGTEILKAMAKHSHGLCGYLEPMPDELSGTTSPQRIPEHMTLKEQNALIDKYGYSEWYSWAHAKWGTKWGCYDNEMESDNYTFTTAWGVFNNSILFKLLKLIPSLQWTWEEEQGFGEEIEYIDGEKVYFLEWSYPSWSDAIQYEGADYYFLESEHTSPMGTFTSGYYYEQDIEDKQEDEDVIKKLNELYLTKNY